MWNRDESEEIEKAETGAWMGGELPEGVTPHPNGTLAFGRPLIQSDGGTYQCVAQNVVGVGKAEVNIGVGDASPSTGLMENMLMIIVGGVAGGLLILMLIVVITLTCHHKRKNKKLEKELTVRKYVDPLFFSCLMI
ncbi:Nectin-1 [Liparis tanakae]|uniref:Nectin-1 n=1 Tax=Liparis tanakae TaxID=230148 RepID=A0A4Z2EA87_9TELE|nr:Nectin-1 [Liparis tanakae]